MKRGSALIIAILLITAVGSVAFGIGRVLFLEVGTAGAYENGMKAFYAAESGMEEGFLRYRYSQEAEVPFASVGGAYNKDTAERVNITDLSVPYSTIERSLNNSLANEKQIYDLQMNPRSGSFGDSDVFADPDKYPDYNIKRDDAKKFKVDFSGNKDINLYIKPKSGTASGPSSLSDYRCSLVEIKIIGRNAGTPLEEHKALFRSPESGICPYGGDVVISDTVPYVWGPGDHDYIVINNVRANTWPAANQTGDSELSIKPIGADVAFYFADSAGNPVQGALTTVESRGYYNGISRKMTANIDRQSGSLYDLFDYVVYKAN